MAKIPGTLQKLAPLRPVLVDKKTAAQWQINCAIRNIFYGECPISNHLIVMSAREILDQYAKKKGTVLKVDIENYIKPQYVKEAKAQWKERYNFLKHSDNDADTITDFTNVQLHNETETFMNIMKYTELFGSWTTHMGLFTAYIMARSQIGSIKAVCRCPTSRGKCFEVSIRRSVGTSATFAKML